MSSILRVVRRARWRNDAFTQLTWNAFPADPLGDMATTENALSVWLIERDKSNLDEVLTAVAASRERVSNIDFVLIPYQELAELIDKYNAIISEVPGKTPHLIANIWHRDLSNLTGNKLLAIAKYFYRYRQDVDRYMPQTVKELLINAYNNDLIEKNKLQPSLREELAEVV